MPATFSPSVGVAQSCKNVTWDDTIFTGGNWIDAYIKAKQDGKHEFIQILTRQLDTNVLALGEKADFGELNCQTITKVDTRLNVQLATEHAFLPNAFLAVVVLFLVRFIVKQFV